MQSYLDLMRHILDHGVDKADRTGTGTRSVFGYQMRFDLQAGFPLVTTKKVHLKSVIHELLWFLKGSSNVTYLNDHGVTIWDEWRVPYRLDREAGLIDPRPQVVPAPYAGTSRTDHLQLDDEGVRLAELWTRLMQACHDPADPGYPDLGARGVTVHPVWHDPARFIADVRTLPHWFYKQKDWSNFVLDLSYYGAAQYGPDTAVWLRNDEVELYARQNHPTALQVTAPDGTTTVHVGRDTVAGVLSGLPGDFQGYEFRVLPIDAQLLRLNLIPHGELGPVYGVQWREWPDPREGTTIDQIARVIDQIKRNPDSRRLIVSAWNPSEVDGMALPPCHTMFQFYVSGGRLSCQLYMRSTDVFLGAPFNIASYSLLTMMVAQVCGLQPGEFILTMGDAHLYANHFEQVKLQLSRPPHPLPTMWIDPSVQDIGDFTFDSFKLLDYKAHPAIKAPIAV